MKYTTALLAFAVGALAQSSAITSAPATTSAPALPPSVSCVNSCSAGDVTCQASCLGNARPNTSQVLATNECAAKCDQGDGSKEDSEKFSNCVQDCIAQNFPSSQTGALIPGGAVASSGAATGTASGAASSRPTGSNGASGTDASQTGTGAASAATGAAGSIQARIGGAGLAGLLAAFAL